jgi:hypothetical protein
MVLPSKKVTTPVAVFGDTVATSVYVSPGMAGFSVDEMRVVVGAFLTRRRTVADVLGAKEAFPINSALN